VGDQRILDLEGMKELTERLAALPEVARYGEGPDGEAGALAYRLMELEHHFRVFLDELLPRLVDERISREDLLDVLFELGDEFAEIVYDLREPRFFEVYVERGWDAAREAQ
jgi:hypothetical protein